MYLVVLLPVINVISLCKELINILEDKAALQSCDAMYTYTLPLSVL